MTTTRKSKVFVLTLADDHARRAPLLQALQRQQIDFELFFGVDGRNGLPAQYEAMIDRDEAERAVRRRLTDAEFACSLSHRAIYERMLSEHLDAALILEDDAIVSPRLGEFLQAGGCFAAPMILLDYSRVSVSPLSGRPFQSFGHLWRVVVTPCFATGYVLSAWAARELLRRTTPVRSIPDWPCDIHELKAYALHPRLVDHLPVGNTLSHLAADRDQTKTRKKSPRRWLTRLYWATYLRRRLSKRIDP